MELRAKLAVLDQMDAIYDRFVADHNLACAKFCAHCCTANVTMTTLEGARILAHLEASGQTQWLAQIAQRAPAGRFQPQVSINRMADICARDDDPPEEAPDPATGPCVILTDDACPLYAVRPFGCRCMVSVSNCGHTGCAEMDPLILTVNDVFLQYIEHIDAQGYTGNFADVLQLLSDDAKRQAYAAGRLGPAPAGMAANQPVFVLMVPPEHRQAVQPLLDEIRAIEV